MQQYLDLMQRIISTGEQRDDRTGTGTVSLFGEHLKFDLSQGFPLLTTKKVHTHSIIEELLWFLRGSTNNNELVDRKVSIWNEWATPDGRLSKIYGFQWRRWDRYSNWKDRIGLIRLNTTKMPTVHPCPSVAYIEDSRFDDCREAAYAMWNDLMTQCNDQVVPEWKDFNAFIAHLQDVPGFKEWRSNPAEFALNKDYFGSTYYGPGTVMLLPIGYSKYISHSASIKRSVAINKVTGERIEFTYPPIFYEMASTVTDEDVCLDNWTVEEINPPAGYAYRQLFFNDQIEDLIQTIKARPFSRRHIVSAWNVSDLPDEAISPQANVEQGRMSLAPCHVMFQFYVHTDNRLSCHLYQRSADYFLGVPFNIASYAFLVHIIAQQTGLIPGTLHITFGDVHIYKNHLTDDIVYKQLQRTPTTLPTLKLTHKDHFLDYTIDDFELINYNPHSTISAPISV